MDENQDGMSAVSISFTPILVILYVIEIISNENKSLAIIIKSVYNTLAKIFLEYFWEGHK